MRLLVAALVLLALPGAASAAVVDAPQFRDGPALAGADALWLEAPEEVGRGGALRRSRPDGTVVTLWSAAASPDACVVLPSFAGSATRSAAVALLGERDSDGCAFTSAQLLLGGAAAPLGVAEQSVSEECSPTAVALEQNTLAVARRSCAAGTLELVDLAGGEPRSLAAIPPGRIAARVALAGRFAAVLLEGESDGAPALLVVDREADAEVYRLELPAGGETPAFFDLEADGTVVVEADGLAWASVAEPQLHPIAVDALAGRFGLAGGRLAVRRRDDFAVIDFSGAVVRSFDQHDGTGLGGADFDGARLVWAHAGIHNEPFQAGPAAPAPRALPVRGGRARERRVARGAITAPALASAAGGGALALWSAGPEPARVLARLLNARGAPVGGVRRLSRAAGARDAQAARGAGGYVAVWTQGEGAVVARALDARGRPRGAVQTIGQAGRGPSVAWDRVSRAFLVAWSGPGGELRARRLGPDARPRGEAAALGPLSEAAPAANPLRVRATAGGGWLLVHSTGASVSALRLDRRGLERGVGVEVGAAAGGPAGIALAWQPRARRFLATWATGTAAFARPLDARGRPIGRRRKLGDGVAGALGATAEVSGRGWLVTWPSSTAGRRVALAARVTASGAPRGALRVSRSTAPGGPDVVGIPGAGAALLTWAGPNALFARPIRLG